MLCILLVVIKFSSINAQQFNQNTTISQYLYKDHAAYAGFDQSISIALLSRNQWLSLPGSPQFRYLSAHLPLYAWKVGFGCDFQSINEGSFKYRIARISINKTIKIPGGVMSFASRIGGHFLKLDGSQIVTPEGIYVDGQINHQDRILSSNSASGLGLSWEIGSFLRLNKVQTGISIANIALNNFNIDDIDFSIEKNINFFIQYNYDFNKSLQFQPSLVLKSNFKLIQTEINAIAKINGNVFGGMILRGYSSSSLDALGFLIGHRLNRRYSVFYAYDLGLSKLRTVHEGSHEIMLKIHFYDLPATGLPPKIIYNPRFLID